jgi:hypothetical protein
VSQSSLERPHGIFAINLFASYFIADFQKESQVFLPGWNEFGGGFICYSRKGEALVQVHQSEPITRNARDKSIPISSSKGFVPHHRDMIKEEEKDGREKE